MKAFFLLCVPGANFLGCSCKGELDLAAYKFNELFSHPFASNTRNFKILSKPVGFPCKLLLSPAVRQPSKYKLTVSPSALFASCFSRSYANFSWFLLDIAF